MTTVRVSLHWAVHGKKPRDIDEYRVLASSGGPLDREGFKVAIDALDVGDDWNQIRGREGPDWVTFGPRAVGARLYLGMVVRRSTGLIDGRGRVITRARCVLMPEGVVDPARAGYLGLFRDLPREDPPDGALLELDLQPLDPEALSRDIERLGFDFVATVAALVLESPRVALVADGPEPVEDRLAGLDAIMALLPFGCRFCLTATSWMADTSERDIRLGFMRQPRTSQVAVDWLKRQAPQPPTREGREYLDMLRALHHARGTAWLVQKLLHHAQPLPLDDPQEILEILSSLDRSRRMLRMVRDGTADPNELRRFLGESADRFDGTELLESLRYLLQSPSPPDAGLIQALEEQGQIRSHELQHELASLADAALRGVWDDETLRHSLTLACRAGGSYEVAGHLTRSRFTNERVRRLLPSGFGLEPADAEALLRHLLSPPRLDDVALVRGMADRGQVRLAELRDLALELFRTALKSYRSSDLLAASYSLVGDAGASSVARGFLTAERWASRDIVRSLLSGKPHPPQEELQWMLDHLLELPSPLDVDLLCRLGADGALAPEALAQNALHLLDSALRLNWHASALLYPIRLAADTNARRLVRKLAERASGPHSGRQQSDLQRALSSLAVICMDASDGGMRDHLRDLLVDEESGELLYRLVSVTPKADRPVLLCRLETRGGRALDRLRLLRAACGLATSQHPQHVLVDDALEPGRCSETAALIVADLALEHGALDPVVRAVWRRLVVADELDDGFVDRWVQWIERAARSRHGSLWTQVQLDMLALRFGVDVVSQAGSEWLAGQHTEAGAYVSAFLALYSSSEMDHERNETVRRLLGRLDGLLTQGKVVVERALELLGGVLGAKPVANEVQDELDAWATRKAEARPALVESHWFLERWRSRFEQNRERKRGVATMDLVDRMNSDMGAGALADLAVEVVQPNPCRQLRTFCSAAMRAGLLRDKDAVDEFLRHYVVRVHQAKDDWNPAYKAELEFVKAIAAGGLGETLRHEYPRHIAYEIAKNALRGAILLPAVRQILAPQERQALKDAAAEFRKL